MVREGPRTTPLIGETADGVGWREAYNSWVRNLYYAIKPALPRPAQIALRRWLVRQQRKRCGAVWPIDERAGAVPAGWPGWPEEKRFALVLTHDVDTATGHARCGDLSRLEEALGFRSSFNFVPERYAVSPELRRDLAARGFEVGVHGLRHDGRLYQSREVFRERAARINATLREWGAVGFRSPAMHHRLDWIGDLQIRYDASTFDTDPFEPQADGVQTIFPFRVTGPGGASSYLELPYTLPQDFTLFVLMREQGIDIWKKKLDWIAARGGMALVNVHPDYMCFNGETPGREEYPARYYAAFLQYVKERHGGAYWHVLPRDLARHLSEPSGKAGRAAQGGGRQERAEVRV